MLRVNRGFLQGCQTFRYIIEANLTGGPAFGNADMVGIIRCPQIMHNSFARFLPRSRAKRQGCSIHDRERKIASRNRLFGAFPFPTAGTLVIFPVKYICCPRKRRNVKFPIYSMST